MQVKALKSVMHSVLMAPWLSADCQKKLYIYLESVIYS